MVILYVEGMFPQSVDCSFLDWVGAELPDDATILELAKRNYARSGIESTARIVLYTMRKRGIPFDRLTVLNVKHPAPKNKGGSLMWDWKDLDYHLEDEWQLK